MTGASRQENSGMDYPVKEWKGVRESAEFDYQWKELPSQRVEYSLDRVEELLDFTGLPPSYFVGKKALDAGCGNGRYTFALQQLGAIVDSFDISRQAVERCKSINPHAYVFDLRNLTAPRSYDFVLCWGVLHHTENPRESFSRIASQVRPTGILHIMVYHKKTQRVYQEGRRLWRGMSLEQKMRYCEEMVRRHGGNVHGWWDAFNPEFNFSFLPGEIKRWFEEEDFKDITLVSKYNINMRGVRRQSDGLANCSYSTRPQ